MIDLQRSKSYPCRPLFESLSNYYHISRISNFHFQLPPVVIQFQIHFGRTLRTIVNFTRSTCNSMSILRSFLLSNSQLNENKGSWRDRNGWAGKVNEGRARLNSSSRILVASGFDCRPLESIPYLFANRYAEFPIPKLIFASSNFDTYQHSGCAVLLHKLQRQR